MSDDKWDRFLDPGQLKTNLVAAPVYIAGFELLKNAIQDRPKGIFVHAEDSDENSDGSRRYKAEVVSRNRSLTHASLDWLHETGVLSAEDLAVFEVVKELRNRLAHELLSVVEDGLPAEWTERFSQMTELLRKIETWWILEVEVPGNAEYDGMSISEADVTPGGVLALQLLLQAAGGSEVEAAERYSRYRGGRREA